jgi:hypothetical protein
MDQDFRLKKRQLDLAVFAQNIEGIREAKKAFEDYIHELGEEELPPQTYEQAKKVLAKAQEILDKANSKPQETQEEKDKESKYNIEIVLDILVSMIDIPSVESTNHTLPQFVMIIIVDGSMPKEKKKMSIRSQARNSHFKFMQQSLNARPKLEVMTGFSVSLSKEKAEPNIHRSCPSRLFRSLQESDDTPGQKKKEIVYFVEELEGVLLNVCIVIAILTFCRCSLIDLRFL